MAWYETILRHTVAPPKVPNPKRALDGKDHAHFPRLDNESDHPTRWEFPGYLDKSVPWVGSLAKLYDNPMSFPASLSPDAGMLLHALVRNLQPRLIVEVGTFIGISTHWIAGALQAQQVEPSTRVHCFDDFGPVPRGPHRDVEMDEDRLSFVRDRLGESELDEYCHFHPGDSSSEIEASRAELLAAGGVDMAFIDGDHSERGVLKDFLAIEPVLNTGGYIVLHDIFPDRCGHDGPRSLIEKTRSLGEGVMRRLGMDMAAPYVFEHASVVGEGVYQKLELHLAPLNYGLAVLRRKG